MGIMQMCDGYFFALEFELDFALMDDEKLEIEPHICGT